MTDLKIITPISEKQREQVSAATVACISKASALFDRQFIELPVDFDLRGKCAGMYQVRAHQRRIRYNPWIFAKYYQESLTNTVVHEVAHYIVDCIWGLRKVKPHGEEWRQTMIAMGAEPTVTGKYDLTGIPTRQYQRYAYNCDCRVHQLTLLRHKKIISRAASYRCQFCHSDLKQGG